MDINDLDEIYRKWVNENGLDEDFLRLPSQWLPSDPYIEELEFLLDDHTFDAETPIPDILNAYAVSLWAGTTVPVDHPLITNANKFRTALIDLGFGKADVTTLKQLFIILKNTVKRPELLETMGTIDQWVEWIEGPSASTSEGTKIVSLPAGDFFVAVLDIGVAFADAHSGDVRIFDFDGNEKFVGDNKDNILAHIAQSPKTVIDTGELASVIGNELADRVIGDQGISILDLPPNEH